MNARQHRHNIEKRMRDVAATGGAELHVFDAGVRKDRDGTWRAYVACISDMVDSVTGRALPPIIFQSDTALPAFAIKEPKYLDDLQRELMEARL